MRTILLAVALLPLAGCQLYEGPNLGGTWDAVVGEGWDTDRIARVTTTSQSLVLAHDPGAWLDWELTGTFTDARGSSWAIQADPYVADISPLITGTHPAPGVVIGGAANGEWRVTLRGGLFLIDDAGQRAELDVGPLGWSLTGLHGGEWLILDVGPVQRALGIDPPEEPIRRVTFARRGAPGRPPPPASPSPTANTATGPSPPPAAADRCAGCGEPLEARWTVCPVCARPRPADGQPGRPAGGEPR